jgi:hypothetical protein
MLFYPVVADNNIEAIIYPSVQKKKFGENFAIRNELILDKYNLIGVETRFILDEYEDLDPSSDKVTTDQLIGSFGTTEFDFDLGKILYKEEDAQKLFKLFRELQTSKGKQTRYEYPNIPKNIAFNLSPKKSNANKQSKIGRNERVDVVYQNGTKKENVKYKSIISDITEGKCKIAKY